MPLSDLSADVLNSHEPQRQNNVLLHIVGLSGTDDATLVLALESSPLPKENTNPIELHHLNQVRKYAGKTTYDDLSVVYKDLVTADVAAVLQTWRTLVHDSTTGKTGFALTYKKNGYFVTYGPDGTTPKQYNVYGIWPSGFDRGDMDMQGDDFIRITLNLTLDQVRPAATAEVAPGAYPTY